MSETRDKIISAAVRMVRTGGYNSFSFRLIASEIGIKSASVHHHFATKEDLAQVVARKYAEAFFKELGEPKGDCRSSIKQYCEVFASAFRDSRQACLCGILSHESPQLPDSVKQVVIGFVESNINWLEKAIGSGKKNKAKARMIYASLEGAMGVAVLTQHSEWIENVSMIINDVVVDN